MFTIKCLKTKKKQKMTSYKHFKKINNSINLYLYDICAYVTVCAWILNIYVYMDIYKTILENIFFTDSKIFIKLSQKLILFPALRNLLKMRTSFRANKKSKIKIWKVKIYFSILHHQQVFYKSSTLKCVVLYGTKSGCFCLGKTLSSG